MRRFLTLTIVAVAVLFGPASGRVDDGALAASGCADLDGDGFVHVTDITIWSNYFGDTVPPAPPQADLVKDGSLAASDFTVLFNELFTSTACQTSPLPSTTSVGGALVVDADGENTAAGDPVESTREVVIGETFHVTIQLTSSPGIVALQQRLHWDEAPLDLNARTALDNDLWVNVQPAAGRRQTLGPADDNSGNDAYIELGSAPFKGAESSTFLGPVAQFEFVCQQFGTANLTLAAGHSLLADTPSTEYSPTLAGAQVQCVCPPEGCPVGGIAALPDVPAAPLEADGAAGSSARLIALAVAGAAALGAGAWFARRRRPSR